MLSVHRLVLTAGLFLALIGGSFGTVKHSIDVLGMNWNQVVESYKMLQALDEQSNIMEFEDSIVLKTISAKEDLIRLFLAGQANLLQTASQFRIVDEPIHLMKNKRSPSAEYYYIQVASWAILSIRRHSPQEEPAVVRMIQSELDAITGHSNSLARILDGMSLN